MAKACGLSQATISRIWRAFSLAPHRAETFKLSRDPLLIDKVPISSACILTRRTVRWCSVWTSGRRSKRSDRTAPLLPMRPDQIERRTHDSQRHGTTSLFAARNTQSGKIIEQRHRSREFRNFLDTIEENVPA
jgi:hypothetical protein